MAMQVFPTKGNLIAIKKQLQLAKLGYELLDRKRNIMLREMLAMAEVAVELQEKSNAAFEEAYTLLQYANFTTGQKVVMEISQMVPVRDHLTIRYKSVMGIEIPEVVDEEEFMPELNYGIGRTNSYVDKTLIKFNIAKSLAAKQAALENSIYRLAFAIKQAQKRANALKNIVIPRFDEQIIYIQSYLEEKEREEFTAMKMVKTSKL
jgi:H(+)-transporting ATP synthase, vacuolar type, subunit D